MSLSAVFGAVCVVSAAAMKPDINGDTDTWIYNTEHSDEFSSSALSTTRWKQSIGDWRGNFFCMSRVKFAY